MVEASAAEFFEARVIEPSGEQLRVQSLQGKQSRLVAAGDVYRLARSGSAPPVGLAICKIAEARWIGCRIDAPSAAGERVTAIDMTGARLDLAASDVLAPTAVTELNLRRAFEQAGRRIEFDSAVKHAGRPHAPRGWRPSPRERVLARDGNAWFPARIHEIEDERVHVVWKSDERLTELPIVDVVPEPPHGRPIVRGTMVLVRPKTVAAPWPAMRVRAAGNEIVLENAEGESLRVTAYDVVPLAP